MQDAKTGGSRWVPDIREDEITEFQEQNGDETATYKAVNVHPIISRVLDKLAFFRTHVSAVWYNKLANKTVKDKLDEIDTSISSLNSNISNLDSNMATVESKADQAFQQASDGKTAIANAISGKGVSASASETFASLASKITNNLYKPPAYLSGEVYFSNISAGQYSQHVTFSTAFGPIPKVTVATNHPDTSTVSAYNITRNGFDVKLTSTFSGKGYYTVTWTASA